VPLTLDDLDDPFFGQLPQEEQAKGRREVFQDLQRNNAQFRELPIEERRKVLFPVEEEVEPARPELTFTGELVGGAKEFVSGLPGAEPNPEAGAGMELGIIRMLSSPLAQLYNMSTAAGVEILERTPDRTIGGINIKDVAAGITTGAIDVLAPGGLVKALGRLKKMVKVLLPTRAEKAAELQATAQAGQAGAEATATAEIGVAQQEATATARGVTLERAQQAKKLQPKALQADAVTAEEAGTQFQKVFTAGRKEAVDSFNTRYTQLIDEADKIPAESTNFQSALKGVQGEAGIVKGALPTKAETTAKRIAQGIDEPVEQITTAQVEAATRKALGRNRSLQIQDEVYQRIKDKITKGGPGRPDVLTKDIFDEALIPIGPESTAGDMVEGVLRLRAAKRGAADAGNRNLARQFDEIEKSLLADIKTASPETALKFANVTDDYAKQFIPLFGSKAIPQRIINQVREDPANIVGQIIQPAQAPRRKEAITRGFQILKNPKDRELLTGAWFRGGIDEASKSGQFQPAQFIKWWDKYVDPKTNDFVLKTALGERYKPVKGFVDELREAKQVNFNKVADEAVTNILKRRGERIAGATATKDAQIKQITKELEDALKEIAPNQLSPNSLHYLGPITIVSGASTIALGAPAAGIAQIGFGVFEVINHQTFIGLINSLKGAQFLVKAARTVPGTVQAVAAVRALDNFAKGLKP